MLLLARYLVTFQIFRGFEELMHYVWTFILFKLRESDTIKMSRVHKLKNVKWKSLYKFLILVLNFIFCNVWIIYWIQYSFNHSPISSGVIEYCFCILHFTLIMIIQCYYSYSYLKCLLYCEINSNISHGDILIISFGLKNEMYSIKIMIITNKTHLNRFEVAFESVAFNQSVQLKCPLECLKNTKNNNQTSHVAHVCAYQCVLIWILKHKSRMIRSLNRKIEIWKTKFDLGNI